MADKKNAKENILVNAAKTVGAAAGEVASKITSLTKRGETKESAGKPAEAKPSKLVKKNKSRLPRRQKKALKKAAAKEASKVRAKS